MTLLLSNEEIERVLDMRRVLGALEEAYQDLAAARGAPGLRADIAAPSGYPDGVYALKAQTAVFPRKEVAAVRLTSDVVTWRSHEGGRQRHKVPAAPGDRWVGLIMLLSTRTGEPLAIFPDGVVQRARVGATSGLAMARLARPEAAELAIVGSGWQAGAQAMAACAVRALRKVRVFSPTREHREQFCSLWQKALGVPFQPVESVREAVRGADVVLCATNSTRPVLEAGLVEAGMHIGFIRMPEAGADAVARAEVVVRHAAEQVTHQILPGADSPEVRSDRGADSSRKERLQSLPELVDLIGGRVPGRTRPEQVTCFLNNYGIGLQFAAVGHAVLEAARERGLGRELPTEWFTENVHP